MKYILEYKSFVIEQNTQDVMAVSKQYNIKDMQNKIKEFESQIVKIRSVFQNDKINDSEIPNLLKDYLKDKDVNKFVFENEFSQLEADICNLSRKIRQKELKLTNLSKDLEAERGNVTPLDKDSKGMNQQAMSSIKQNQDSAKSELVDLKQQLLQKEESKNKVLKDFENKILNLKKEVTLNK
jgi:predicted  nucleic acid-binding Zn-ribbon protein